MSRHILMATVAALALATPALAQDPAEAPIDTEMKALQLAQNTALPENTEGGKPAAPPAAEAEGATQAPDPVTAEEQPAAGADQAEDATQPPELPATAEQPTAQPAEQAATEEQETPPAEMKFLEVQDEAQFLADEEVIGKSVVNVMDEDVGTIADLVMDQEQKLVGVVLSVGGFLGLGEKWVAIPVDQIQFPGDDQPARLLVAVTEEQLTNAPDFKTRAAVEAEEEAAQAQQQQMQQQTPSPATTTQ